MTELIVIYLPWLLSILTIIMSVMAGSLHKHTWTLGLVNQFLWLVWIVSSQTWGLIPLNVVLWIVYFRNHAKWKQPATT